MTYIPSSGSLNWITALDLDLTTQGNQTLNSDTNFTIGGLTWTKMNTANDASPMTLTNGSGVIITPNSTSNISAGTFTPPALRIPITTLIPTFTFATPIRIWAWISASNEAANFDEAVFGITVPNAGFPNQLTYNVFRGFSGAANGWGSQITMLDSNVLFTSPASQPLTGNRVGVMMMPSGIMGGLAPLATGSTVSGGIWPSLNSLNMTTIGASTSAASGSISNSSSGAHAISEVNFFFGAIRAGSATAFTCTFARFRVDYLPFTN
jgi:hypothetical protein